MDGILVLEHRSAGVASNIKQWHFPSELFLNLILWPTDRMEYGIPVEIGTSTPEVNHSAFALCVVVRFVCSCMSHFAARACNALYLYTWPLILHPMDIIIIIPPFKVFVDPHWNSQLDVYTSCDQGSKAFVNFTSSYWFSDYIHRPSGQEQRRWCCDFSSPSTCYL